MQPQTPETIALQILPYNEIADLIDRQVHARTLEQINFLAREYEVKNPPQVAKFLSENVFLLDLLKEIPAHVRKHFGAEQKMTLEFLLDPEDPSHHRLHASIPTPLSVKESMQLLDRFDEEWWLDNERRSYSKILVNLEYLK